MPDNYTNVGSIRIEKAAVRFKVQIYWIDSAASPRLAPPRRHLIPPGAGFEPFAEGDKI